MLNLVPYTALVLHAPKAVTSFCNTPLADMHAGMLTRWQDSVQESVQAHKVAQMV